MEAMDACLSNGWVEEVNYGSGQTGKFWNLPHHAVFREDKTTTKCRVVFDGSVRYEGQSLNDHLEPGPALQTDLIGILLRFRRYRFVLQADISKMFMQIGLHEDDRDVTRYLWRNMNTDIPPGIFRFKRLTFGLRSSPFVAVMVVQRHARLRVQTYKRAAEVLSSMYVDDFLSSCTDSDEAEQLVDQLRKLMQLGGFNLTQWKCNSSSVAEAIGVTDVKGNNDKIVSKILGVPWNLGQDALSFVTPHDAVSKSCETKRDYFGSGWDESIPDVLNAKWNRWKQGLHMLPQLLVQRTLIPVDIHVVSSVELHAFADASDKAYGAVVHMKAETVSANNFVNMVIAKSHVAPLKKITLPRLELTVALVAARLVCYVKREIEMTVDRVNRVQEIQTLVDSANWYYCAGKDNPADLLSRGTTIENLKSNSYWWHEPAWLKMPEGFWPKDDKMSELTDVHPQTVKREGRRKIVGWLETEAEQNSDEQYGTVVLNVCYE
ncbi:hypothetical protein M514_20819 [Trichuris suis]|uniref:Reverse transcriptase domain-containing protein n=1 Tax=Trichuris suis TaxID=68888 RepID=A0A085NBV7_9BILA|nr:hypothetical protein M514_20819 [Trichuris suis]